MTPPLDVKTVPISFQEKLPLRVAILISEEDAAKMYSQSFFDGVKTVTTALPLTAGVQDTLRLSLSPMFDRVTLVRARPAPGAYHMVLVPRVLDARWNYSLRFTGAEVGFVVSGALSVLDQAGSELVALRAEGTDTRFLPAGIGEPGFGAVASQAVSDLVKKWGERLAEAPQVEQYASRVRPARPGTTAQASDVSITFSYPGEAARVAEATITVVGLVSTPRGLQRLELAVNGQSAPVSRDVRVQPTGVQSHPFTAEVQLRPGTNLITITAIDNAGGASQAVRTVFREVTGAAVGAPARAGERWAVVIGIDRYKDPAINTLRYAIADAEAVFRFLTTKGGVKPANARLLLNQDATQRNIRQTLGDFLRQKALKDDEVVIYYAGHGTTEPDQGAEGGLAKYLVPWDADPQSLFSTAIPMEEIDRIFGRLSARKILMIQDTCFSGGAGGRTFLAKGLTVRSAAITDRFLQELSQKEGRMILTASDVNQVSEEDPVLGHGIFTYYLLEALNGAADLDGDGAITVRELHLYLQRRVHERSNGAQTPQLYNIGDMVLVQEQRGTR